MMKRFTLGFQEVFCGVLFLVLGSCASVPSGGKGTEAPLPSGVGVLPESSGWKLIWADEFDKDGAPDPEKWTNEEYPPYTYNAELQAYTSRPENCRVEKGRMIIEARKDGWEGYDYTSSRITTDMNFAFAYGRIEFRAKLPGGLGTWPALWLMPSNSMGHGKQWPDSGEIDVMETVGHEVERSFATLHTAAYNHAIGTQRQGILSVPEMYTSWHVYAADWYPDHITCSVDGKEFFTVRKNEGDDWKAWPFDLNFYIIMNLAVGGAWGGQKGVDVASFPARMEVDYVRVYQNPEVKASTHKP